MYGTRVSCRRERLRELLYDGYMDVYAYLRCVRYTYPITDNCWVVIYNFEVCTSRAEGGTKDAVAYLTGSGVFIQLF